jgi:hypothetical protein
VQCAQSGERTGKSSLLQIGEEQPATDWGRVALPTTEREHMALRSKSGATTKSVENTPLLQSTVARVR